MSITRLCPLRQLRRLSNMMHADHSDKVAFWIEQAGRVKGLVLRHSESDQVLRVLDIGCGRPYWASVVFSSWGWNVTGVDIEDVRPHCSYLGIARMFGTRYALKRLVKDALVMPRLFDQLTEALDRPVDYRGLDIRQMDVTGHLPFGEEAFDLVFSHVVLEHVSDVPAALAEVHRVLKPNGLTYQTIHLFPSLSGGHIGAWLDPLRPPEGNRPWDHLRGGPSLPGLNKLRLRDYREYFGASFEILEWEKHEAGVHLLTPEIRAELADYTEEDLLTGTVSVLARKKG